MHAVCWFNPPLNDIHWLCLQGELHSSRHPDITYFMGGILVVIPIRIADWCGEEIHCRLEVRIWPEADEQYLCHKNVEKVGLRTRQCFPIFSHFKHMVRCWGLGDAVYFLWFCLYDDLYMFRHSDAYLAFCSIIQPHTEVVMHVASADG